jgi:hypothetical protein
MQTTTTQTANDKGVRHDWFARIRDHHRAAAEARRQHAMAVWGDDTTPPAWEPRPDRMYRAMGVAWGARR